jgi:hypothetical protein
MVAGADHAPMGWTLHPASLTTGLPAEDRL